nr:MAG TPA: hypothetical protein [Caudoviricetes sp.]
MPIYLPSIEQRLMLWLMYSVSRRLRKDKKRHDLVFRHKKNAARR